MSNQAKTVFQISTTNNPFKLDLIDKIFDADELILKEFFTFYNFYNVKSSDSTNTFTFEENGVGTYNITIPEGYYDITTLISTMANLMTSAGTQTYNAVIGAQSNLVTFSTSGTTTWKFGTENIISRLGYGTTSFSLIQISTNVPIISTQYIEIRIFGTSSRDLLYLNDATVNNLAYKVPIIYSNFGSLIYYQDVANSFSYKLSGQVRNLKFEFYDMWGNLIENNGCPYNLQFSLISNSLQESQFSLENNKIYGNWQG